MDRTMSFDALYPVTIVIENCSLKKEVDIKKSTGVNIKTFIDMYK